MHSLVKKENIRDLDVNVFRASFIETEFSYELAEKSFCSVDFRHGL